MWDVTNGESHIDFAQMGLDRVVPNWKQFDISLPILNLGAGNKTVSGTEPLDWPEWNGETDKLPYEDGDVGGVIAMHFLEHLADPRHVMREVGRVLRKGRPFNILVPHAQSLMYLHDIDHKTPFIIDTWKQMMCSDYYNKGKEAFPFEIGANFLFGLKEANLAVVTQLIKV